MNARRGFARVRLILALFAAAGANAGARWCWESRLMPRETCGCCPNLKQISTALEMYREANTECTWQPPSPLAGIRDSHGRLWALEELPGHELEGADLRGVN